VNPVSVGRALSDQRLIGWWEATAGSTLIYDALKAANKAPFEFKFGKSARAAIRQCCDCNYAAAYQSGNQSGNQTIKQFTTSASTTRRARTSARSTTSPA